MILQIVKHDSNLSHRHTIIYKTIVIISIYPTNGHTREKNNKYIATPKDT